MRVRPPLKPSSPVRAIGRRLVLAVLVAVCGFPVAARQVETTPPAYVLTAFRNGDARSMSVYGSDDAASFMAIALAAYSPPGGLIRDPSIIQTSDGWYRVVYTTDWSSDEIGFARSRDLTHWEFERNLRLPIVGLTNAWAPEWFVDEDGSTHIIVSLSRNGTEGPFQPHLMTASDQALTQWSTPRPMPGLGPNAIDTFVVRQGDSYQAFVKNETTKFIERAAAPALEGPWTIVGSGDWAGWGSWNEGPALVRRLDGGWRLYFDQYVEKRYWHSDSDDLIHWTPRTELAGLSGVVRHFTVLQQQPSPISP